MIFDAHFHIIDKAYPLVANQGFLPEAFTVADYQKKTEALNIKAGAIVSGSFQAYDQSYLIAAIKKLGPNFVGVTQLPEGVSDDEIQTLHQQGIRAIRFNLFRGNIDDLATLVNFAKRVYEQVGWHVELYLDATQLDSLSNTILQLPKVSIDHLGLRKAGFKNLLKLVEKGMHVKACGFMRVDFDVKSALQSIYRINPNALMFGTDLPGTRASRQFSTADLLLIQESFAENEVDNILWHNARQFYL